MADLNGLLNTAQSAEANASNLATQAPTLQDSFASALKQKFGDGNPLIAERGQALSNYITQGTGSAQKYLPENTPNHVIYSPTQIRSLTSQDRANALVPLVGLNTTIGQGYGGLQNVINSATAAYSTQVGAAQDQAKLARQSYQDAYQQWKDQQAFDLQRQQIAATKANNFNPTIGSKGAGKLTPDQVLGAIGTSSKDFHVDENEQHKAALQLMAQFGIDGDSAAQYVNSFLNSKTGGYSSYVPPTQASSPASTPQYTPPGAGGAALRLGAGIQSGVEGLTNALGNTVNWFGQGWR